MEEYVLRGNAAILKCHIPSFVSEYVTVVSWIISEGEEEVEIQLDSSHNLDGTTILYASSLFKQKSTDSYSYFPNRNV